MTVNGMKSNLIGLFLKHFRTMETCLPAGWRILKVEVSDEMHRALCDEFDRRNDSLGPYDLPNGNLTVCGIEFVKEDGPWLCS